jgi:hypothetical protein
MTRTLYLSRSTRGIPVAPANDARHLFEKRTEQDALVCANHCNTCNKENKSLSSTNDSGVQGVAAEIMNDRTDLHT